MREFRYPFHQDFMHNVKNTPKGQPRFAMALTSIRTYRLHYHEFGELALFIDGTGFQSINGVRHRVQAGTVSLVLPSQMHVIDSDPEHPVRKYGCCFDMQLVFGSGDDNDLSHLLYGVGVHTPSFVDLNQAQTEQMKDIMEQLLNESVQTDKVGRRHMIRAKLIEALLIFLRSGMEQARDEGSELSGSLWKIMHYIHTHHQSNLTLEELCSTFNLTASHVSRLLKKHTGQGFMENLHRLRVESAATMLLHTTLPIIDIAYNTGFESLNTFGRVFRKMKGMSA
ncbi:MAG: transcriptional regulator, AraC family, partial [Paenibacillus sp.]|nr:transcriptional regulator, AraC family [Paenibacillus sp.]